MKNFLWGLFAFATLAHAQGTVTDIDGNTYDYLTYGTQQWTVENAAMETYRDGTPIQQVTDATQWSSLTTGAWCYYDNDPTKGKLYNWYAVAGIHDNDPNTPNKEFAPSGWHVPTDAEWTTLEEYLIANGYNYDGTTTGNKIAKSMASTTGWNNSTNAGAVGNDQSLNNSSGFNALPSGLRNADTGVFDYNDRALIWSSSQLSDDDSLKRSLISSNFNLINSGSGKRTGYSVRFIQNSNTCSEGSINVSSNNVCFGGQVDLTASIVASTFSNWNTNEPNNNNGDEHVGMLVENAKWNDHRASNSNPDFLMESDTNLGVISGFNFLGEFEGHFYYQSTSNSTWTNANSTATSLGGYLLIINSQAENDFIAQTSNITVHGSWIGMYQDINHPDYSEPGGAWFWDDGTAVSMSSNPPTYTWSTGDTTANISVNLTETTEYWVDITTNGVTCREYVTIDVTAPVAPTGDAQQTFCDTATIADLTATGDNIQWYDAATGGNLLDSTTVLTDGQMVYASQTVNGCESTDRLEVTVYIDFIDIFLGDDIVGCTSESIILDAGAGFSEYLWSTGETTQTIEVTESGNYSVEVTNSNTAVTEIWINGVLEHTMEFDWIFNNTYSDYLYLGSAYSEPPNSPPPGQSYEQFIGSIDNVEIWNRKLSSLEINSFMNCPPIGNETGLLSYWNFENSDGQIFSDLSQNNNSGEFFNANIISNSYSDGYCIEDSNAVSFDYQTEGSYLRALNPVDNDTDFTVSMWINPSSLNSGFCHIYTGGYVGTAPEFSFYIGLHAIGEQPGEIRFTSQNDYRTYTYLDFDQWQYLTIARRRNPYTQCSTSDSINVTFTAPAAPTGDVEQTFCNAATVADLTATGDNIQWYDSATGGNLLDSATALTDGQMVYASQTINGCESTERLEVSVSIQDITITASATEVCAGESVDLGVTYPQQFNSWTHMVAVYNLDTDLLYFYINGVLRATSDISGIGNIFLTGGGSESRKIGQRAYSNHSSSFFWGYIDDVGVWDKPLSNIQVTDLYENQNICQVSDLPIELQSNLIAYYPFCNSLVDIGGGHNGTNFGATASTDRFGNENSSFHFDGTSYVTIPTSLNLNNTSGGWTLSAWANPDFIANSIPNANYILDLTDGTGNNNWGDRTVLGLVEDGYRTGCHADNNISASYGVTAPFSTPPSILWSTGDTTTNISVTPTETTEYWVDVTTNGVTCREYVTINVTAPAAPTGNAEQTFCDTATIADLTATGDNIQWYDAAIGGNLLDSTTALTDGQIVYASQTVNGCESTDRLEVTVSVQDINLDLGENIVACQGETIILDAGSGYDSYLWSTGETTQTISVTEAGSYSVTINQFQNQNSGIINLDGSNDFIEVNHDVLNNQSSGTIQIRCKFDSPTNNKNIFFYGSENDSMRGLELRANDQGPFWSWHPGPGNVEYVYSNVTVDVFEWHTYTAQWTPDSMQLFVDGELVGESNSISPNLSNLDSRIRMGRMGNSSSTYSNLSIDFLKVYNTNLYTSSFDQCDQSSQNGLILDYSFNTNDNSIVIDESSSGFNGELVNGPLWQEVLIPSCSSCEFSDTINIAFNNVPEAPTGETVNYFINCDSFSPTLNDVIATLTGDNIKLYDAAVGGNLLDPNSNIIDNQVVYASQTLDSCESSDRLEVQLNLYTLDTPTTAAPNNTVSFCNEQNLTLLDLGPAQTASEKLWYETATSTIPIPETTPLVDGVTYYVSNYDIETGCESDRLAMTVEINNPEAPTGDAVQSFCDNVTVSDLSASGSNIQWYDAATGGNVLDLSSALSDGQLLYASQTQNGCESITRLEVSVEIDIIPDPILITTELEFCLAREATLADLEVDEQDFALEWYDSFSGGNMLPMDTLLEDGVSYYATLYDAISGCESLMRLEIVPTVIPCEVVIYNAISLNDNGVNDYMVIENAEYFPDNSLEVYNRDGHLLYSQTQYGIGDNLFRGVANVSGIYGSTLSGDGPRLPTGSYLYVFKYFNPYEQQQYTLKGFLTINSN